MTPILIQLLSYFTKGWVLIFQKRETNMKLDGSREYIYHYDKSTLDALRHHYMLPNTGL